MAQSLFKTLKHQRPELAVDVLAPNWTRPLLTRMPEVREAIDLPLGHGELGLWTRYRLGRTLRDRRYSSAYVLPGSFKSALVPFWARIPRRVGYLGEQRWGLLNDVRRLDPSTAAGTAARFVSLAYSPQAPLPDSIPPPLLVVDPAETRATTSRLHLQTARPVLALCPGAEYGPAKRWPARYFAKLAQTKLKAGWSVWLLGSASDAAVSARIAAEAGEGCRDLTGRTSLAEAVDLLGQASLVVSNDSGLMHVAAALNRPLVAIFGSSDPQRTPPLSSRARVEHLGLPCSPCFKRKCPLKHLRCLRDLHPEQVLLSMERAVSE